MESPLASLVRLRTKDGLELQGLLFVPLKPSTKIVIHIHGWVGNFFENLFIDELAKESVRNGWAFLTFNNRGAGIITDFIGERGTSCTYERIGGSFEPFKESRLDIDAAAVFAAEQGYKDIVLEGHSLGCQKAAFYSLTSSNKKIRGLVFLAPIDTVACVRMMLRHKTTESITLAKRLAKRAPLKRLPQHMEFYPLLTPSRFLDLASPQTFAGSILDCNGPMELLRALCVPVLAVFCENDQYQPDTRRALKTLKKTIPCCDTRLLAEGGHLFPKKEKALARSVSAWIRKRDIL